jgi:hypothetical protein
MKQTRQRTLTKPPHNFPRSSTSGSLSLHTSTSSALAVYHCVLGTAGIGHCSYAVQHT